MIRREPKVFPAALETIFRCHPAGLRYLRAAERPTADPVAESQHDRSEREEMAA
jgi:hypothetical protein